MADYTTYADGSVVANKSGSNAAGYPAVTVLTGEFDASKRPLASGDTMAVINVPANTYVLKVSIDVDTIDASQAVDIGDDATADGWGEDLSVASGGGVADLDADFNATGKLYTEADTIDILVPASKYLDTAKFTINATCAILG